MQAPLTTSRDVTYVHAISNAGGTAYTDPTACMETPRLWKALPQTLSIHEVQSLLQFPEHTRRYAARDRAILKRSMHRVCEFPN